MSKHPHPPLHFLPPPPRLPLLLTTVSATARNPRCQHGGRRRRERKVQTMLSFSAVRRCAANLASLLTIALFAFLLLVLPTYPVWTCREDAAATPRWRTHGPLQAEAVQRAVGPARNVWVVADPQLAYRKRGTTAEYLNNKMNDVFFSFVTRVMRWWKGHFDTVLVLGDLAAHWRLRDEEFYDVDQRLVHSFGVPHERAPGSLFHEPFYFLAGNHDIGYADALSVPSIKEVARRFEETYNVRHWELPVTAGSARFLFVACDGMELDGALDDTQRHSWDFLRGVAARRDTLGREETTVVLLMHIPLWKPAGSCPGDVPAQKLSPSGGIAWQNTLSEKTTKWILRHLRPDVVFTGHDHEGCTYVHPNVSVTEYTVRSVMGDYAGNTAVLRLYERGTVAVQQCPAFTTHTVVVCVIAAPVVVVVFLLYSWVVMRRSRQKSKYD